VPGRVADLDSVLRLPEFEESARPNGVQFFGLCNQTLFKLKPGGNVGSHSTASDADMALNLPASFPIERITIGFSPLPADRPHANEVLSNLYDHAKSSIYFDNLAILQLRFDITERVLGYIYDQLPDYFRKYSGEDKSEVRKSWPYLMGLRNLAIFLSRHLAVYSNICKAGSLDMRNGYTVVAGRNDAVRSYTSDVSYISNLESEKGKRLLRELDFKKNWDFYINLKGTILGKPETPIEIAVSNFTDLFDDGYDQSGARNLIWGFAGLEAILADNETSIGSQLRQKLVALFGNQVDAVEFEREIAEIYKFRSKIIHGKDKGGSVLRIFGGQFLQPLPQGDESRIAIWLLLAVIQYCFQNKQSALKFKTVVT
jgi:hypothetical protein